MYKKEAEGWLKHLDFILLDMLCLQLAFWLAYILRKEGMNPYASMLYRNMALFLEMADVIVLLSMGTFRGVLRRGHYREFLITAKQVIALSALSVLYLFAFQKGEAYSRIIFGLTVVLYLFP